MDKVIINYMAIPGLKGDLDLPLTLYINNLLDALFEFANSYFNKKFTVKDLRSPSRKRELITLRQAFCYIHKHKSLFPSLEACGEFLGGRDHTTIIHSHRTFQNLLDTRDVTALNIYKHLQNRRIL